MANGPEEAEIPDKLKVGKDGKPDVTPIVMALQARLSKMEDNENLPGYCPGSFSLFCPGSYCDRARMLGCFVTKLIDAYGGITP